jgi:hypothetical protein
MKLNDITCTREIKSWITTTQTACREKNNLAASNLEINLRKKIMEYYIWSIALYVAENWTLWNVDRKYLESSEIQF